MNSARIFFLGFLLHCTLLSAIAQPILLQPNTRPILGNSISNLRVIDQSPDGSEVLLGMDVTYDGFGGQTALVVPVIEKKDQKGVSRWFGADPMTVPVGKGPISIKVKYFNDEEGVPPEITTDRVRVLILNSTATAVISSSPNLKTIKWGNPNARPVMKSTLPTIAVDASSPSEASERARKAAAAAERARQEARTRAEAEAKAREEARRREEARIKAEAEAQRLAEERRIAEERAAAEEQAREDARILAEAEAKAREVARLKAEAEARRLAEERRIAEERAAAEAKAREEARLKAEEEEKARKEAEARALAEAKAREEARAKAEAEAKRLAEEKRQAEERARLEAQAQLKARLEAEARAREEARRAAEAEAKRLEEERRLAEERAAAEARAREEARLKAEAEEKKRREEETRLAAEAQAREVARLKAEAEARRLAEEKRIAEQRAAAEAKAREEARRRAEAEARRLAGERKLAEERLKAEAEAARLAEEKARLEAEARARAEEEARLQEAARLLAEQQAKETAEVSAPPFMPSTAKTKILNVDVVNRSLDRSQMTIGVEFDYEDKLPKPVLGVEVGRSGDSRSGALFETPRAEIKKRSQKLALFPVRYQPPDNRAFDTISTDRLLIYLQDALTMQRYDLLPVSMILTWRAPGAVAQKSTTSTGSLRLDDFKQTDLFSGYLVLNYTLSAAKGTIRTRLYQADNVKSATWFSIDDIPVKQGEGTQMVRIAVRPDADSPGDLVRADTLEIELVDDAGTVVTTLKKESTLNWARPK